MIELSHVYKSYPGPVHALRDVSLRIERGSLTLLTGPSGAGKSSLFRLLYGADIPTHGEVKVAGQSLAGPLTPSLPQFRRRLGIVFQDFRLLMDRSVISNVALPLEIAGVDSKQIQLRCWSLLEELGLSERALDLPHQLSGGEQQRVAIARSLVHQPELLLADEPTGNLDPDHAREVFALFAAACRRGTTVFVATHNPELASGLLARRLHLSAGQISASQAA